MLQLLESRLDNIVYRLGFGATRAQARQMVSHGHVSVNGGKMTIPSYTAKINDVVEVKDRSASRQLATRNLEYSTSRVVPEWLQLEKDAFRGAVMRVPTRDEIQPIADEQTIVEFIPVNLFVLVDGESNYTGLVMNGNNGDEARLKLLKNKTLCQ